MEFSNTLFRDTGGNKCVHQPETKLTQIIFFSTLFRVFMYFICNIIRFIFKYLKSSTLWLILILYLFGRCVKYYCGSKSWHHTKGLHRELSLSSHPYLPVSMTPSFHPIPIHPLKVSTFMTLWYIVLPHFFRTKEEILPSLLHEEQQHIIDALVYLCSSNFKCLQLETKPPSLFNSLPPGKAAGILQQPILKLLSYRIKFKFLSQR